MLVEIGEPTTPYFLAVFKSPETDWIYNTLKYVVLRARKEVVVYLLTQLEELMEIESDDIDLVVVETFLLYELESRDTLASWCREKIITYSQNENYRLDEIKEILKRIETSF